MEITPSKKKQVWEKARLIDKATFKNPDIQNSDDEFRLDDFGGIMKWDDYGKQTEYAWTLDHILPVSKGGTDHFINLQALNWKNNISKADSFFGNNIATGITGGSPYHNTLGAPLLSYLSLKALKELETVYTDNSFVKEAIQIHFENSLSFISI